MAQPKLLRAQLDYCLIVIQKLDEVYIRWRGFLLEFFNMQNREKVQRHNAHTLLPSPISPLACFTVTVGSVNSKKHHRSKEV